MIFQLLCYKDSVKTRLNSIDIIQSFNIYSLCVGHNSRCWGQNCEQSDEGPNFISFQWGQGMENWMHVEENPVNK